VAVAASNDWNDNPLVRSLPRSLWQVTQYCFTNAFCSATVNVVEAGACETTGLAACVATP
jgi:hypothetical protein